MPNIRSIDMLFLEDLFAMGGGYVLNFSDRTYSQFFAEELNCDIDHPAYAVNGKSKGTSSNERCGGLPRRDLLSLVCATFFHKRTYDAK